MVTYEEFKKQEKENNYNVVEKWDYDRFPITCGECQSKNVRLVSDLEFDIEGGCPTCGSWLESEGALIVKCIDCGHSMSVLTGKDIQYEEYEEIKNDKNSKRIK